MKICHVTAADDRWASYRYRVAIPAPFLNDLGAEVYVDTEPMPEALNVYHKHFTDTQPMIARTGGIFDITDHHFRNEELAPHYRHMCGMADLITCSSRELVRVIRRETGRASMYVPDPYEFPEAPCSWPGSQSRTLWFGHQTNFKTLEHINFDGPLEIVTSCEQPVGKVNVRMRPWNHENMLQAFSRADFVILPQFDDEKSRAKGNNRAVNALRQGRFVIASRIPSYEELGDYIYLVDNRDMLEGIEWARQNMENAEIMVMTGQTYVAREYSPERVASEWLAAFEEASKAESRVRQTTA